jgi:hypothetical protein
MKIDNKPKAFKNNKYSNVIESLKDVGSGTVKSVKEDFINKIPTDVMDQLFGSNTAKNTSGEIIPGESLEFREVLSGVREEKEILQKQISFEKRLFEEEKIQVQKKTNELRVQLKVVMDEVFVLSKTTQDLGQEIQIATMQAPIEPGVYHVIFFEKLLEFIKSFRKKIEEASVWLHATNKRAEKKNYWSKFKKHGGKFLLSPDHYLTRSAG